MKQPKIKIFGKVYKVTQIEFDKKTGKVDKIVYQIDEYQCKTVFKSDEMLSTSLTSKYKIQKPTQTHHHNYAYAPNLESLFV